MRWTKGGFTFGQSEAGVAQGFIMLLGMLHNLKLRNDFWNFSYSIFGPWVTETAESETMDERGYIKNGHFKLNFVVGYRWCRGML